MSSQATVHTESIGLEDSSHRPTQVNRRPTAALAISVAIMVAVIAGYVAYLARYATNGVYWDEWNWVDLIRRSYGGTLTLGSLWAQHTENRMLFPNIVVVMLGDATGFSDVAFMYLGAILLVAGVLSLVVACRQDLLAHPLAYVPATFVFFSLCQYENTLWGFQFAWFLIVACICAVLALLSGPRLSVVAWIRAVTIGIVASYSSFGGLTVWAAGLLALLRPGISMRLRIAWVAAGSLVTAFYLYDLNLRSVGGPTLSGFLTRLPTALNGYLVAVGSVVPIAAPVTRDSDLSATMIFGALITAGGLLTVASWMVNGRNDRVLTIAAGLVVVGLLFDLALMPTRLSAGVINGTVSRYTTFNLLLLGGIYMGAVRTMFIAVDRGMRPRIATSTTFLGLAAALVLVQVLTAIHAGAIGGIRTRAAHAEAANLTANHAVAPPSLVKVFAYPPSYAYFEIEAAFLERNHLNVFGDGESAEYRASGVLAGGVVGSPLPVPPEFGNIQSDASQWRAWLALSSVYEQRPDLQAAFPGPTTQASRRMVAWAVRSGQNPTEPIYAPVLTPYSAQYAAWLGEEK